MSESHVSSYIPIKPVHVQLVKIVIPPDTFQQHLLKTLNMLFLMPQHLNCLKLTMCQLM
jgi:hypothetical protein